MTNLTIGDKAPQFKGIDENGNPISLSDFKGKNVILYFYPKDMTPGCTTQSCNLRDNYSDLTKKGFDVIGVSADSPERHLKFIAKHELPFHLIADEDKTILNAYGVWGLKKFMGKEYDGIHRTTFVINEAGIITSVIKKVKTKDHAKQILLELESIK
jgi:peroxiredoxin Q/BCP